MAAACSFHVAAPRPPSSGRQLPTSLLLGATRALTTCTPSSKTLHRRPASHSAACTGFYNLETGSVRMRRTHRCEGHRSPWAQGREWRNGTTQTPGLGTLMDLPSTKTHTGQGPPKTYCAPGPFCNSSVTSPTRTTFCVFQALLAFLRVYDQKLHGLGPQYHILDSFVINIPPASQRHLMAHNNITVTKTSARRQEPRVKTEETFDFCGTNLKTIFKTQSFRNDLQ